MKHRGCPYREGRDGRSMAPRPANGGAGVTARLQCSRCPVVGTRAVRSDLASKMIDRAFRNAGWRLDPIVCPGCQHAHTGKEKSMSSAKPSAAAMKAQGQMFTLLSAYFDVDRGAYHAGWSDERIAKDTGLAKDLVVDFRRNCFGELKEPPEIAALRGDITALEALNREAQASFAQSLAELRSRLAGLSERAIGR